MELDARVGPGQFQWNRGGWFGSIAGATIWFMLLGCLLMAHGRMMGAAALALGLLPNGIGLFLWQRRNTMAPYPALQVVLGASGLCALTSLFILSRASEFDPSVQLTWVWKGLWLYPFLMLVFHLQERAGRRDSA